MDSYIFIVGKSDPQSSSAQAIRQAGYKVGLFHDASTTLTHPEMFDFILKVNFEQLDTELARFDHTLPVQVAGLVSTYENYVVAKAKLGLYLDVAVGSIAAAQNCTDKFLMRQAFFAYDASITPTFKLVSSVDEIKAFARDKHYPLFIKPTNLVKSLLVLKCQNEQELIEHFLYAQREITGLYRKYRVLETPQLIVEEGISGKSYSIAAFVDRDGTPHFCPGIVAIESASDIGRSDNYLYSRTLPAVTTDQATQELLRVAEAGVRALDMRSTPAHIELMYDGTHCKIIEIGARIGGYRPRMYGHSYDMNLSAQEVALALGRRPDCHGEFKKYSAVFELFSEVDGRFECIEGADAGLTEQYTYFKVTRTQGQQTGPAKHGHKAAGIIIITSPELVEFQQLCKTVARLKVKVA